MFERTLVVTVTVMLAAKITFCSHLNTSRQYLSEISIFHVEHEQFVYRSNSDKKPVPRSDCGWWWNLWFGCGCKVV